MTTYDPIDFTFQVHNDAVVTETAYLCPSGLPWGTTLKVSPSQADIAPGTAAVFHCRLTLDGTIIEPGCTNDQGFQLTAWRVAHDADEPWGSCFYYVRPRVHTSIEIENAQWYWSDLKVHGRLSLMTDQPVHLDDELPARVRVRIDVDDPNVPGKWTTAAVHPGGPSRSTSRTSPVPTTRNSECKRGSTAPSYCHQAEATSSNAPITSRPSPSETDMNACVYGPARKPISPLRRRNRPGRCGLPR